MSNILASIALSLFSGIFFSPATPHCTYEDGSELTKPGQVCKWDASEDGINGVGDSFVVIVQSNGERIYVYTDRIER